MVCHSKPGAAKGKDKKVVEKETYEGRLEGKLSKSHLSPHFSCEMVREWTDGELDAYHN